MRSTRHRYHIPFDLQPRFFFCKIRHKFIFARDFFQFEKQQLRMIPTNGHLLNFYRISWSFLFSRDMTAFAGTWVKQWNKSIDVSHRDLGSSLESIETGMLIKNSGDYMGVSKNSGFSPKSSIFNRVFHYKPSILGYPYFRKHPYGRQEPPPAIF